MQLPSAPKRIPASARPFFQEYTIRMMDVNQHSALIISRILAYGNRAEVRWLLDTYGREQVIEWVRKYGARQLSRRRYALWCFVFALPKQKKLEGIWPH